MENSPSSVRCRASSPRADDIEAKIKLRSYQQEMLEASLRRNVIVAMETGSGKTAVATFRILAELERTDSSKLVWFVTPNVALSLQQHDVLSRQLPGYLIKTLLGSDGVDKWTDQNLWDATLHNVRVAVGTPAVLADAFTHGFVHISRLSLIVFDEAHHCLGKHPMNRIMKDFYHPAKSEGGSIPHILGLSASPIISSKSTSLQKLEASLDALTITPKQHRLELDTYVHPPEVKVLEFASPPPYAELEASHSTALLRLLQSYDLATDPYVVELQELIDAGDAKAHIAYEKVQLKCKTWCTEQLATLRRKSVAVREQLGAFAAEWYVSKCQSQYIEAAGAEPLLLGDVNEKERAHLAHLFRTTMPDEGKVASALELTPKAQLLVDVLRQHSTPSSKMRAVIFAEQRAVVTALGYLLQSTPELADYSFGTYVGTSVSDKRKTTLSDLVDLKAQAQRLESFRGDGQVNVLISTSVLEEGIDVSACNLVICFDSSKTLAQYVQRRGRARQAGSKYIILAAEGDSGAESRRWASLEEQMREIYRDEGRAQSHELEEEKDGQKYYSVPSTGALLHLDNAKAHLYHFCQVSTLAGSFVDVRPEFSAEIDHNDRWSTEVILPTFVHTSLRTATSKEKWSKEENAIKDAAFEAYIALHKAGLVNDNLLPLKRDYGPDPGQVHVDQPSIVEVSETLSSWRALGRLAAMEEAQWYTSTLRLLREDGSEVLTVQMCLPERLDVSHLIDLYWNQSVRYQVRTESSKQPVLMNAVDQAKLQRTTDQLLRTVYASKMRPTSDILPFLLHNEELQQCGRADNTEGRGSNEALVPGSVPTECGLVRVKGETGRAYFLSGVDHDQDTGAHLATLTAFPKRRDFLHPLHSGDQNAAHTAKQTVPLDKCLADAMPAKYALFAALVPSVLHRIDTSTIAGHLQSSILPNVPITLHLLIEAISSPSAQEPFDYNRLEFLGDAVLKFCAVLHVMAKHPTWPEGYLGLEKFRIVSNKTLARAALDAGLDKYILTKPFTGAKWRPPYVNEMLEAEVGAREMSSKVLADVVEALIGAAFVEGGLNKAYDCIRVLLPAEAWIPLQDCISIVVAESPQSRRLEISLLERLAGHTFKNPELLIEALTHASFPGAGGGSSYERLEFLGDAVLDLVIVPRLFAHHRKVRHWDLHRMRDALVNGDFLAYCCMQDSVAEERRDVVPHKNGFDVQQSERTVHLHDFLRAGSQLTKAKRECLQLSEPYLLDIQQALQNGDQYPWSELIAFKPPKFFSDIIESTLGALFLDSAGDLSACEDFVERLGIFQEMGRILDEHVETAYPKEQLGILADKEKVEYQCASRVDQDRCKTFDCIVKVGEEDVASASGLRSREEAELRAACKATKVLQGRMKLNGKKRKLDVVMMNDRDAAMGASSHE